MKKDLTRIAKQRSHGKKTSNGARTSLIGEW